LTAVRQISSVSVPIFEVFHATSHTADTHSAIFVDMGKLIKEVYSRTLLLYEEFNHSMLAVGHRTPSIIISINIHKKMQLITFGVALINK
jgi:hypothetical protein